METLTKENFWDEMEQGYPKSMAHFKEWVDKYKSEHDWRKLFNGGIGYRQEGWEGKFVSTETPKYHELPIAMQFGIFLDWYYQVSKPLFLGGSVHYGDKPNFSIKVMLQGLEPWFEGGQLP